MKTLLAWSTGKDSAWALHVLRNGGAHQVVGLLTTINTAADRVAMHAVRRELLLAQASALALPVFEIPIPQSCTNDRYDALMEAAVGRARADGVEAIAFGDLFLDDIRRYREERLAPTGMAPLFPLWQLPTGLLAQDMVKAGLRAHITCVDPRHLDRSFVGRTFDASFLSDLPKTVDPCGENGEYHSFAFAGPMFPAPLGIEPGTIVERDGFVFSDLTLAGSTPDPIPPWIPKEAREHLDLGELHTEDELVLRERDRLERSLGHHVAAYQQGANGRKHGLCTMFACADLSASQIASLKQAEGRFPDVVFVAYARPLRPQPSR